MMIAALMVANLAAGFVFGHAFAVWSRRRFIHSLMPATGEHTDLDEDEPQSPWGDAQRAGYQVADGRLDRVRPGAGGHAVHDQSSTDPEARNHVR